MRRPAASSSAKSRPVSLAEMRRMTATALSFSISRSSGAASSMPSLPGPPMPLEAVPKRPGDGPPVGAPPPVSMTSLWLRAMDRAMADATAALPGPPTDRPPAAHAGCGCGGRLRLLCKHHALVSQRSSRQSCLGVSLGNRRSWCWYCSRFLGSHCCSWTWAFSGGGAGSWSGRHVGGEQAPVDERIMYEGLQSIMKFTC